MPSGPHPPAPSPAPSTPDFSTLPRFYTYREVFDLYRDDEDAFLDAYCSGALPRLVRAVCEDTLGDPRLHTLLLRRMVRQQAHLLALLEHRP